MPTPRLKVPKTASLGEIIKIKAQLSHPMESGQRKDKEGTVIPRMIVNKFECLFNDAVVFFCDLDPAVAANPYLEFRVKIEESGTLKFVWTDDDGTVTEAEREIEVS